MGLSCKCCKKEPVFDCNSRWTPNNGLDYRVTAAGGWVSITNPFLGGGPDQYGGINGFASPVIPVPIDGEPGGPLKLAGGPLNFGPQSLPGVQRGIGDWGWNPHAIRFDRFREYPDQKIYGDPLIDGDLRMPGYKSHDEYPEVAPMDFAPAAGGDDYGPCLLTGPFVPIDETGPYKSTNQVQIYGTMIGAPSPDPDPEPIAISSSPDTAVSLEDWNFASADTEEYVPTNEFGKPSERVIFDKVPFRPPPEFIIDRREAIQIGYACECDYRVPNPNYNPDCQSTNPDGDDYCPPGSTAFYEDKYVYPYISRKVPIIIWVYYNSRVGKDPVQIDQVPITAFKPIRPGREQRLTRSTGLTYAARAAGYLPDSDDWGPLTGSHGRVGLNSADTLLGDPLYVLPDGAHRISHELVRINTDIAFTHQTFYAATGGVDQEVYSTTDAGVLWYGHTCATQWPILARAVRQKYSGKGQVAFSDVLFKKHYTEWDYISDVIKQPVGGEINYLERPRRPTYYNGIFEYSYDMGERIFEPPLGEEWDTTPWLQVLEMHETLIGERYTGPAIMPLAGLGGPSNIIFSDRFTDFNDLTIGNEGPCRYPLDPFNLSGADPEIPIEVLDPECTSSTDSIVQQHLDILVGQSMYTWYGSSNSEYFTGEYLPGGIPVYYPKIEPGTIEEVSFTSRDDGFFENDDDYNIVGGGNKVYPWFLGSETVEYHYRPRSYPHQSPRGPQLAPWTQYIDSGIGSQAPIQVNLDWVEQVGETPYGDMFFPEFPWYLTNRGKTSPEYYGAPFYKVESIDTYYGAETGDIYRNKASNFAGGLRTLGWGTSLWVGGPRMESLWRQTDDFNFSLAGAGGSTLMDIRYLDRDGDIVSPDTKHMNNRISMSSFPYEDVEVDGIRYSFQSLGGRVPGRLAVNVDGGFQPGPDPGILVTEEKDFRCDVGPGTYYGTCGYSLQANVSPWHSSEIQNGRNYVFEDQDTGRLVQFSSVYNPVGRPGCILRTTGVIECDPDSRYQFVGEGSVNSAGEFVAYTPPTGLSNALRYQFVPEAPPATDIVRLTPNFDGEGTYQYTRWEDGVHVSDGDDRWEYINQGLQEDNNGNGPWDDNKYIRNSFISGGRPQTAYWGFEDVPDDFGRVIDVQVMIRDKTDSVVLNEGVRYQLVFRRPGPNGSFFNTIVTNEVTQTYTAFSDEFTNRVIGFNLLNTDAYTRLLWNDVQLKIEHFENDGEDTDYYISEIELVMRYEVDVPLSGNPTADAGPDQNAQSGDTVTLDGSGSTDENGFVYTDPGFRELVFAWEQIEGTAVALSNANGMQPTFTAPEPEAFDPDGESLVFQLTVYDYESTVDGLDGVIGSIPDTVIIQVQSGNYIPTANAGPDRSYDPTSAGATPDGNEVTLDGSASIDPEDEPLTFAWSQIDGPSVTLSNPSVVQPTFFAPKVVATDEIKYVFSLIVSDGVTNSDPDTVNITIVNSPPVADAGANQTVTEGDLVTLDGSASYDPEAEPLIFVWTQVGGFETIVLADSASAQPTFIAPAPRIPFNSGDLKFKLIVSDGINNSDPEFVTITVMSET